MSRQHRVVRGESSPQLTELERWVGRHPHIPVDPVRDRLYTPDELYDATPYERSFDARAYRWSRSPRSRADALGRALHDHAIDLALDAWVDGRRLVGVMGGHTVPRGSTPYADAARLAHGIGGGLVVASGGGPGAMEAANLGARLAGAPTEELTAALARLARVPSFHPSVDDWLEAARAVAATLPDRRPTLGIPTWHYGHEPPNIFATAIAKYFRNSTREATLLSICDAGIVFLPGVAGTLQEVFQDACENYYATEAELAPMVLVGTTYWTEELPAWPLLRDLARGNAMEQHVHLAADIDEAVALIASA